MRKTLWIFLAVLYLAGLADTRSFSYAMMLNLTPEQRDEAIKYGKRGVGKEVDEFIKEWKAWAVDKGTTGFALITTEFLSLAYAARQKALQSGDLDSFEIDDALSKSSGKLVFRVTLLGSTPDFTRDYTAVLRVGDETFPSTFWSNPPGEPYDDEKMKPAFVTDSDFYFPAQGINPNAKVLLVIHHKDGKEAAKFSFNLDALR